MWNDLEKGFQVAFEAAWTSYCLKNVPIGASVLNENGDIVAVGQNQIQANGNGILSFHQLAHAEANAILQLSEVMEPNLHPNIRNYTLYAVMEPCPFCFGAIVMGSIRHLKFAAHDGWAGATSINQSIDYIKMKGITVEGPFKELEFVKIAVQTCFEIEHGCTIHNPVLEKWNLYCANGVSLGKELAESKILDKYAKESMTFSAVYNNMINFG